jgi:PKD repeat protein
LLPVADFEADDTHIVMGETVQFTDLTSNNPTTWAWMFPGGTPASSSLQNPMIKYEESGVFDVSLVVQNEFGSDTKSIEGYITVDSTIGITELLENGLSVFPNPLTGDILNIDSRSQIEKIELFDYSGKKVLQKHLNSKTAGINMQGLNKGIYILKVYSAKGLSVVKVSVVK